MIITKETGLVILF